MTKEVWIGEYLNGIWWSEPGNHLYPIEEAIS